MNNALDNVIENRAPMQFNFVNRPNPNRRPRYLRPYGGDHNENRIDYGFEMHPLVQGPFFFGGRGLGNFRKPRGG